MGKNVILLSLKRELERMSVGLALCRRFSSPNVWFITPSPFSLWCPLQSRWMSLQPLSFLYPYGQNHLLRSVDLTRLTGFPQVNELFRVHVFQHLVWLSAREDLLIHASMCSVCGVGLLVWICHKYDSTFTTGNCRLGVESC